METEKPKVKNSDWTPEQRADLRRLIINGAIIIGAVAIAAIVMGLVTLAINAV